MNFISPVWDAYFSEQAGVSPAYKCSHPEVSNANVALLAVTSHEADTCHCRVTRHCCTMCRYPGLRRASTPTINARYAATRLTSATIRTCMVYLQKKAWRLKTVFALSLYFFALLDFLSDACGAADLT